jgi:L-lactate dehydrogenase complex protein LldE
MRPRVQLFVTCLVEHLFPSAGIAVANVLERHGVDVAVPDGQTCCGQPAFNAGFVDDARAMATHTIAMLSADDAPVVVPSGSCADMIVHQFPALLAQDPSLAEQARQLAERTCEFTQYLVDVLGVEDADASAAGGCLTYHACCHGLRGLGVDRQPRTLLAHVRGAEHRALEEADVCCGFGGLFSVKLADVSGAMLKRKLDCIEACGADTVAVTDVSCGMHMQGGLRRRGSRVAVRHIAEILAGEPS